MKLKTFEIRTINIKNRKYLKNYIYKYRHWQNILTIFIINLFKRTNRGLFKDTVINKIFSTDLNSIPNYIRLALNKSFKWLKDYLNLIKLKSTGELHNLLCNIHSNKSYERRMTALAYRYFTIY